MRRLIQRAARLLHIGLLPDSLRDSLEADGGLLWLEEGIPVTAILQGFKAPGMFCGYRRMSFIGFAALTNRRIVISAHFLNKAAVDVAYSNPLFRAVSFNVSDDGRNLSASFDADGILPDASGRVTLRLGVADVPGATRILTEHGNVDFRAPDG